MMRKVARQSFEACALTLFAVLACAKPAHAASASENAASNEWSSYGKDNSQQRYSALRAINTTTIGRLSLEWALQLPDETNLQATPLMVDGTLYFTGKFSVVYAVDGRSGRVKWTFDPKAREQLAATPRRMTYNWGTSRGVGYWRHTILVATADGRLISLAAGTGKPLWSAQTLDPSIPYLYITGAPLVFNDSVLIGNAGGDFGPSRGYVTAYAAATGKMLWRTYTVPGDPANGFESDAMRMAAATWTPGWWKTTGGGNVWNAMTFDAELNRIYIGTGNGSPWNHEVSGRARGDNLFVASIVALEATSGRYVWHYQVVPGDNWDFDATQDLVLADLPLNGRRRPVLMQANKDGFFYVIDRTSGKLVSAEKFARVTWADRVDLATGRPVEAANMRPRDAAAPAFTVWPWLNGAHNWPAMSFSPRTGLVYIPGMDVKQILDPRGLDPRSYKADRVEQWIGYSDIVGRSEEARRVSQADTFKQSAWIQARDPRTNRMVWQITQPGLWAGGTLVTAGNLVFIGQATGELVAYDAGTGAEVWKFACGRPISAPPISYELDGIQYVAVLVGWGGMPAVEGALTEPALRMTYRDGGRGLFVFKLGGAGSFQSQPVAAVVPIDVPNFTPDSAKVKLGEHLFDNNCNLCHGTDALSGGSAPDLRASPLAADRHILGDIVLEGRLQLRGMPQYVDFSNDDVDSLYHYIRWRARTDLECQARLASGADRACYAGFVN